MRSAKEPRGDQDKKLFVGGLHPSTTDAHLRDFYSQWGDIVDVVVMKDQPSGKSRGFGFVTYADSSAVDAAQAARPHEVGGKQIDCKRAMPREEASPEARASVKKIFVGALKKDVTDEDLSAYFSQYGPVLKASVVKSKDLNESRGFAFVSFDDTDAVDKVIVSKPHSINGNKIDVRKALSKEEMRNVRPKGPRGPEGRQWGSPPSWNNQRYDNGYNQDYGYEADGNGGGYGYGAQGYGYDNPQQPWAPSGYGDSGFGNYPQQSYGGGPVRGSNPPPYNRPAPYGQNNWQQRQ